jgi:hypothetical protein
MARFGVLIRTVLLWLAISAVPAALLLLLTGRPRLALAGPVLGALACGALFPLAGRVMTRVHRARPAAEVAGLEATFARALEGSRPGPVALKVFPDPAPNALVLRGAFSTPTLLVSEGLLSLLSEPELRAVLAECARRSRQPGCALRTLCAALSAGLLRLAPRRWARAMWQGARDDSRALTVGSFLGFLTLFPVLTTLQRIGGRASRDEAAGRGEDLVLNGAMRKLDQALRRWQTSQTPAGAALYLRRPWAQNSVVSL